MQLKLQKINVALGYLLAKVALIKNLDQTISERVSLPFALFRNH